MGQTDDSWKKGEQNIPQTAAKQICRKTNIQNEVHLIIDSTISKTHLHVQIDSTSIFIPLVFIHTTGYVALGLFKSMSFWIILNAININ